MLHTIVKEDDSNVEAWNRLAFANYSLGKFKSAKTCCKQVQKALKKYKIDYPALQQGTLQIWEDSCKALKDWSEASESDDFESDSDSNIDDINEEADVEML